MKANLKIRRGAAWQSWEVPFEAGQTVLDGLRAGVVRLHVLLRGTQIAIPWTTI